MTRMRTFVMLSRIGLKWQQNWSRNMETCADFLNNFRRGRGRLLTPRPPVPQSSPPFTPISPPHLPARHSPACTGLPRTTDQRTECTLSSSHTVLRTAQSTWPKVSPPRFCTLSLWVAPSILLQTPVLKGIRHDKRLHVNAERGSGGSRGNLGSESTRVQCGFPRPCLLQTNEFGVRADFLLGLFS